jgi:hypothetical protein
MVRLDLFGVRLGLGLRLGLGVIVGFGIGGVFVGVAGCNAQPLVPTDGGAHTGSGGSTGIGNRNGGTALEPGTDSGAGGFIGEIGSGGFIGENGSGGFIGAAGRPFGGAAGHGSGVGGGAGSGGPPVDASMTTPPVDGGACQCLLGADGVLRMSWDCFTANFGGGAPMSGWCGGGVAGGWVSSCGLDVFELNRDDPTIPDDEWVYDASGTLVGQQIAGDGTPVFVCPSDPSLTAALVAGGQFPPSGCAATDCSCGDAGAVDCPVPDAGATRINPF